MAKQRWHIRPGLQTIVSRFALCAALTSFFHASASQGFGAPNSHAMGKVPCSWNVPIEQPDHRLDVAATIQLLKQNKFTCYVQPIEEKSPMAYDDFERLLPAAQEAGIDIWAVLVTKTIGRGSLPYGDDYVRWMKELGKLSVRYPVLRGVNIDDTDAGGMDRVFTHKYLCEINQAKQKANPKLLFVPTIYDLDQEEADRYAGCVDGVWLWWGNLEKNENLRSFLRNSRAIAAGRFPVYAGVYAHSTSWHKEGGPKPKILKKSMQFGCTYTDGVVVWQLPLTGEENPWLAVVQEFLPGGDDPLAGHCGEAPR
jgi:hypothetical protein